jgi:drug/metabolite transporter (DMT)-like permease
MNWLFYAILAPAMFTVIVFVDKHIVEREAPDYRSLPVFTAIMSLVYGTLFWIASGFVTLPLRDALLVMLVGVLNTWAGYVYFTILIGEQTSNVIVLFQMVPVLILALSYVFLRERITPRQLAGFVLILSAAVATSIRRDAGAFRLSAVFWLVLLADVMWATTHVLFKYVVREYAFVRLISYESWGMAVGGLMLYLTVPAVRRSLAHNLRAMRKLGMGMFALNEGAYIAAKMIALRADSLGPIALVSVLGSTEVFFGLLLGWLLTLAAPDTFGEDIRRESLLRKAGLAAVVFGGVWLVR